MKQFTRHTFRTKYNTNFLHFLKIGRHHSTCVSDHLHPHLPYVSCNLWQLEDMQFKFLLCLFLFFVWPNHQSGDRNLWKGEQNVCLATLPPSHLHAAFSWTPPFNFKTVGFLNSVGQFFSICPCNVTAVCFLFQ